MYEAVGPLIRLPICDKVDTKESGCSNSRSSSDVVLSIPIVVQSSFYRLAVLEDEIVTVSIEVTVVFYVWILLRPIAHWRRISSVPAIR
jgi:hypothetical protein